MGGGRYIYSSARIGEGNTSVAEWDIERAVQARYRADIDTLQRFFADGEGDRRDVIQKIRPVLEAYCRNICPTQFGEQEMMGGIITTIRNAGAAHPLSSIVDDLEELNIYCRRYHHGENQNAATEPVDDAELQGYVRRTLNSWAVFFNRCFLFLLSDFYIRFKVGFRGAQKHFDAFVVCGVHFFASSFVLIGYR
jgi:hypothetical protein